MANLEENIVIFKNRHHVLHFIVDGVENLNGFKAYWVMSDDPNETAIITKTTEGNNPEILIDGLKFIVTINETDFMTVPAGDYYYELVLIDNNNKPKQGTIGNVKLKNVVWKNPQ